MYTLTTPGGGCALIVTYTDDVQCLGDTDEINDAIMKKFDDKYDVRQQPNSDLLGMYCIIDDKHVEIVQTAYIEKI